MAVARLSISLPQSIYQSFLDMVNRYKISKSQMMAKFILNQKRQERMRALKAEFEKVSLDPSYQKEAESFAYMVSKNYARNIAPDSASKK